MVRGRDGAEQNWSRRPFCQTRSFAFSQVSTSNICAQPVVALLLLLPASQTSVLYLFPLHRQPHGIAGHEPQTVAGRRWTESGIMPAVGPTSLLPRHLLDLWCTEANAKIGSGQNSQLREPCADPPSVGRA